jgi:hypothetical protein
MKNLALYLLFFACVITFIVLMSNYRKNKYVNSVKEMDYYGNIDSLFLDPDGRMEPAAMLNTKRKIYLDKPIVKKASVGDLVYKRSGSLNFFLVKGNDTIRYNTTYSGDLITE